MTDVRRGYDDRTEDEKTFVSVKNLLKEFGEKPASSANDDDDDDTFRSVKERLRRFDTRQDNNDCDNDNNASTYHIRESIGSTSSAMNTPRSKFSHRSPGSKQMLSEKAYPNLTVPYVIEMGNRSSSSLKENSSDTEGFKYGNVMLKKVEKPVEDRWKRNLAQIESSTNDQRKSEEGVSKVSTYTASSPANYRNPQLYNNRSMSSPTFPVREEKQQNDSVGLKKTGLPMEDRWMKALKKSEEESADSSKPVFVTMKLRNVGTPTSNASPVSSPYDLKRRRMPTTAIYGDRAKGQAEGPRVSDLAKTFSSPQIKLASKGERAEEEKLIGRVPSRPNELNYIRSTLKSSATELEELRKSLNSSTPVAKLIAERNRAAQANRSENRNVYGLPDDRRKSYGRPRSKSATRNSHRRTKSMSSTHTKNSSKDGHAPHEQVRIDSVGSFEGFSNVCWDDFKASDPTAAGNIWDMNLDGSAFLGAQSNAKSCIALDDLSFSNKDKLLPSSSTTSEYTSDSDAYYDCDNYGHSSYIQITLSSGGIIEKYEPVVCMSPTDDSSAEYNSEYGMDISIDPTTSDSKHSTRKALKGAKKFFFGKNKKKNAPIEV